MALKKKIFRMDATLAAAFEAFCQSRAMKQEQAAEAAVFHLVRDMSPAEREDLFVRLHEWKISLGSEPASGPDVGEAVTEALNRPARKAAPAKAKRGRRSA